MLLVLVDLAPSTHDTPPDEQERVLLQELGLHRPELLERPRLVVGTKADAAGVHIQGSDFDGLRISAVTGAGVPDLLHRTAGLVAEARAELPAPETYIVHRPEPEGVQVERADDGAYVVLGKPAERAVAVNDLTDPQALEYVRHRLSRLGVDRALARAGARQGDLVRVGGFEFEYVDQEIEVQGRRRGR
ncbi:MAG TPA: Obg family GTPase CgtA [Acidimicrobiales bacterium]|nr:Obg family GTPase CgtA [Acidimicrobiales bacterium]